MRISQCPMPRSGGSDCWREPHPASPYNLCSEHWRKVVAQWFEDQPATQINCYWCGSLNTVDSVDIGQARCGTCTAKLELDQDMLDMIREESEAKNAGRPTEGVVYYMELADRIKIGFTTNLHVRAKAVPNDRVLAAHPGDYSTERNMHLKFSEERITDRGEWFYKSENLLSHASSIRERYGDPFLVEHGAGEDAAE